MRKSDGAITFRHKNMHMKAEEKKRRNELSELFHKLTIWPFSTILISLKYMLVRHAI